MTRTLPPITVAEYEGPASRIVEPGAWDYVMGGAGDERSLADNRAAWDRIRVRPRILVDVSERDLRTTAFGRTLDHPVIVAPMAAAAGALLTLSTISSVPMEDVAAAASDAPRWFQLYAPDDRDACRALVDRAVAAGFEAVAVTVDLPYPGNRERDIRNAFVLHMGAHLPPSQPVSETGIVELPTMTWDDLAWLRSICPVPLVAKGVLRGDDAARAVEVGCDGIWVSNHGGRQLDTSIAAVDALAEVVPVVRGRALVVVDGGVRRGIDVLKGLARGADLVAVGRPIFWGLAVDGAAGVERILGLVRDELSLAMALAGCRSIAEVTPDLLA